MWPFTKAKLARPEDFPEVIDALAEKLRSEHFVVEADRFRRLTHEFVATTSNEIYYQMRLTLKSLDHEHRALPRHIAVEIHRLVKSIDKICRWR